MTRDKPRGHRKERRAHPMGPAVSDLIPTGYGDFVDGLKARVKLARVRAALSANRELVLLYWTIGRDILAQQAAQGWGAGVIDRLSRDLRREFPDMRGFSPRNLRYMRAIAEAWPDELFVQQVAAKLPWFHLCTVIDRVPDLPGRVFYLEQAITHGWSRAVLSLHIDRNLHARQGQAVSNFPATMPQRDSALAVQALKDPYVFDFLGLGDQAHEREIERAMIAHVRDTLTEMGAGFAFVGRQVRLEVAGAEFFPDLLFYHLALHRYVVVELKAGEFRPEHAGQINFYLSAVDELLRDAVTDGPTIGLVLCRAKNRIIAEYALRDIDKPIGVAELHLTRLLPEGLEERLPTVEAIEAELHDLPDAKGDEE